MGLNADNFLGYTVKDKVTNLTGVAVGYVTYLTGCNQVAIAQPVGADGKIPETTWIDEQRLLIFPAIDRITLDNSNPGHGPAPTARAAPPSR